MRLPGPDATHRWQGRTLIEHHGQPLGSIEVISLDQITNQPELLEVVVDQIDDRDPVEADSRLPRHVAVAVS
jgi:hypothetical protein